MSQVQTVIPYLADKGWMYGLLMTGVVGVVIIGGIQRIATVAEKIVPLMCSVYVLACLYILVLNAGAIPGAVSAIIDGAFNPVAIEGGFIGVLVIGVKRAVFSNEAGVGSAAIAHAAAKVKHPVEEGIVALLEPFIDTVVICTMTALVIVITGAWNDPDAAFVAAREAKQGGALTSLAMTSVIPWFKYVLSAAVFLFAFSTMISWSYYGERCWAWLFGDKSSMAYRILFLVFAFLGSIVTANNVLDFSDLMILGMAFPNILGVLLLSGKVRAMLTEYTGMLESGEIKKTN
jgi:AGCS family alanine or glycine:cation symporter